MDFLDGAFAHHLVHYGYGAIFLIVAGEFLRPTGELATFIVSTVALLVILFFPDGFLGAALSHGARQ